MIGDIIIAIVVCFLVNVAQLVERLSVEQVVVGSSPTIHPILDFCLNRIYYQTVFARCIQAFRDLEIGSEVSIVNLSFIIRF